MAEILALLLTFLKAIGKYRWYGVAIAWLVAVIGYPTKVPRDSRIPANTNSTKPPLAQPLG